MFKIGDHVKYVRRSKVYFWYSKELPHYVVDENRLVLGETYIVEYIYHDGGIKLTEGPGWHDVSMFKLDKKRKEKIKKILSENEQ